MVIPDFKGMVLEPIPHFNSRDHWRVLVMAMESLSLRDCFVRSAGRATMRSAEV